MPENGVCVETVDFTNTKAVDAYLRLLDAYARDPMGGGKPLSRDVLHRLPDDLAQNPAAHALLARTADSELGFATCFVGYSTFQARPLLNLHDIAVMPAVRGQGVGSTLLRAVEALAKSLGCCKVTLEVRTDNVVARRIYERAGFAPALCGLFMDKPL